MRIIGHIDLDAFFASVEEKNNPWMKGYPVVVGADPHTKRGVVATCNYIARTYGIRSALPITKAWECSQAAKKRGQKEVLFVTPDYKKYSILSKEIFAHIQTYVPRMEQVSIDEAYFDLTHVRSYTKAEQLAKEICSSIYKKFGITASIGIAVNKMVAKIACQEKKPNGIFVVLPKDTATFLAPKSVRVLPGIGKVFAQKLLQYGIETIQDVRSSAWDDLEEQFGTHGIQLFQKAHGIGSTHIQTQADDPKSIGEEETFPMDVATLKELTHHVYEIVERVREKMKHKKVQSIETVVLKIRFSDFETHTAQTTLSKPTTDPKVLKATALKLLLPFLEHTQNPKKKAVRLLGISVRGIVFT